jgi:hypothetical protein
MAWAVRLERGSGVRWIARWREPSGKQRGKVFDRRGDALAYARTMEEWKRGEAYIDPDRGRTTLTEFVETELLTDPGLSEKTRATYLGAWERDIAPTLGSRKLNSITRADVRRWLGSLQAAGKGVPTQQMAIRLLSSALSRAEDDERIAKNPASSDAPSEDHSPAAQIPGRSRGL